LINPHDPLPSKKDLRGFPPSVPPTSPKILFISCSLFLKIVPADLGDRRRRKKRFQGSLLVGKLKLRGFDSVEWGVIAKAFSRI
jgi:hypothetical protein